MQRDTMEFDVVIVGAGPAGLSAAIRLAQLNQQHQQNLSICVLEKGSAVGAHILSGAVLDPSGLNQLIPNWKDLSLPFMTPVTEDHFLYLTQKRALRLPTLPHMNNKGNYVISLGRLCQWLGQHAESLGVNIFPGFAVSKLLFNEQEDQVIGVQTGDMGLDTQGNVTSRTQLGINIHAQQTVLAEGCRGYLSEQIIKKFNLRQHSDPQSYGIGIKELWKIDQSKHKLGKIIHTIGWPLDRHTYGGGFLYHYVDNLIAIGLIIGLDYRNPFLNPFQEFQQFKTHPHIKALLEQGECINYGARTLNEGGWQSIPKLTFKGGCLIGCGAGFVNVVKIKGIHNAMKSGIIAADNIFATTPNQRSSEITNYQTAINQSTIKNELHKARNIRPAFHSNLYAGLCYAAFDQFILRGHAPWTFHYQPDHLQLEPAAKYQPIHYPRPDGKITFDRLTQVYLSATRHDEQQPCHLQLRDPDTPIDTNLKIYDSPEQRYCPAGVYEIVKHDNSQPYLQINASNCIHCKACDIKDPTQNITWVTPQGGDGPNYQNM